MEADASGKIHHGSAELTGLAALASALQHNASQPVVWHTLDQALSAAFGHRLLTVLGYDAASSRLARVYSSRPDINPVGGRKKVTESRWTQHVLREGRLFIGSNAADIKAVFSEYELLWSIGCESVLNIPIRKQGVTIGSINLLDGPARYDHADLAPAVVFAQLCIAPLERALAALQRPDLDDSALEQV